MQVESLPGMHQALAFNHGEGGLTVLIITRLGDSCLGCYLSLRKQRKENHHKSEGFPGLHIEFGASYDHIVRPCTRKQRKRKKKMERKLHNKTIFLTIKEH